MSTNYPSPAVSRSRNPLLRVAAMLGLLGGAPSKISHPTDMTGPVASSSGSPGFTAPYVNQRKRRRRARQMNRHGGTL